MGGRAAIVGLIAAVFVVLGGGPVPGPSTATAELRIPGLFGGKKVVKRRRYRKSRPVLPARNPDRVFAAISAAAVSPKIAEESRVEVVVGTAASAMVSFAIPASNVKTASVQPSALLREDESLAKDQDTDEDDTSREDEASPEDGNEPKEASIADANESAAAGADETESQTSAKDDDGVEEGRAENSIEEDAATLAENAPDAGRSDGAQDEDAESVAAAEPSTEGDKTAEAEAGEERGSQNARADEKLDIAAENEEASTPGQTRDGASETATNAEPDAEVEPEKQNVAETDTAKAGKAETSKDSNARALSKEAELDIAPPDATDEPGSEDRAAEDTEIATEVAALELEEIAPEAEADPGSRAHEVEVELTETAAIEIASPEEKPEDSPSAESKDANEDLRQEARSSTQTPQEELKTAGKAAEDETKAQMDAPAAREPKDEQDLAELAAKAEIDQARARSYDAAVELDISPPPTDDRPTKAGPTDQNDIEIAALGPLGVTLPISESPGAQDGETSEDTKANEDNPASEEASGDETAKEEEPALEIGPPPPPPVDPVVLAVRDRLEGGRAPKIATSDLAALTEVYGDDERKPLWIEGEALSPEARNIVATIKDADDWGLDAGAYGLPSKDERLVTEDDKAASELAVSAAILKYARHAQTGRLTPSKVSKLFDQHPKARDPKTVLIEIAASNTPDKALLATHPREPQYRRLHNALVLARDSAKATGRDPNTDRQVQLIVMNMERWRWLPRELGNYYVWNNVPEFEFRVLKNDRTIYQEKTIVGQYKYATPFFSASMRNVVFHPNWTVPPTIVKEDIAPKLKGPRRGGLFSSESRNTTLRRYGLAVSYKGKPVDADTIDWNNVNIHKYTFVQDPGPANVLGRFKFNFPNKHAIYMHDTVQKELFSRQTRTLSHGCIRVNQPARFAALLLGEDKGWTMGRVQDTLARNQGKKTVIGLNKRVPVHLTYFTAVADEYGSVRDYGDIYGIDNKMARTLFKAPAYFPTPIASESSAPVRSTRVSQSRRRRSNSGLDNLISGILGN